MAVKRAKSVMTPIRATCSGLMALLLLSLLSLFQVEATASATANLGGPSISTARQGDAVALLRVTAKAQGLEIRAGRPVPAKAVSGNAAAIAPATGLFLLDQAWPVPAAAPSAFISAPRVHANQPRAPPSV
ncbi:hypothetical protein [Mesorhizobium caraganae]|uniref:hypothetical protein n=1 Tax=Mesorhizobium caraganae TaxID=483206 RepID=UPI003337DEE2